ncbi:phosphoribosylaminoimidazolesuccinocarboxamide synthase [bacterium]|nr:MAG: phosphoribosylaminoimidazolesuccinocarboxamide synthase [bacterium]RKZ24907.1 MAG: phosphoribosylaminoimidazolesuccinocarboxamide synthase [bacterium]
MSEVLEKIDIPGLELYKRGKVRDVFFLEDKLLFVATDRISAFDWVLPTPIPGKGKVLNALSVFWFKKTEKLVKNHFITDNPAEFGIDVPEIKERSMVVEKTEVIPFECIVRGYLAGSAWRSYKKTGMVGEYKLPEGLREAEKFEEPLFTPTTKAEAGHDKDVTFKEMEDKLGSEKARFLREKSIELYLFARDYLERKGIILADTKFEFGIKDGEIILIDEIFTPDSSRFWPLDSYIPGKPQLDLDKEFVRQYLLSTGWDRNSPPPELPPEIVERTKERYEKLYKLVVE